MPNVDTKFVPKDITIAAKVESSETMDKIQFFLQGCIFFGMSIVTTSGAILFVTRRSFHSNTLTEIIGPSANGNTLRFSVVAELTSSGE